MTSRHLIERMTDGLYRAQAGATVTRMHRDDDHGRRRKRDLARWLASLPWLVWIAVVLLGAAPLRSHWGAAVAPWLALALVPPLLGLGLGHVRWLLALDEREQRIELLAMSLAFALALLGLLLLALLDLLQVHVGIAPLWAFYLVWGSYQLARHHLTRRSA